MREIEQLGQLVRQFSRELSDETQHREKLEGRVTTIGEAVARLEGAASARLPAALEDTGLLPWMVKNAKWLWRLGCALAIAYSLFHNPDAAKIEKLDKTVKWMETFGGL